MVHNQQIENKLKTNGNIYTHTSKIRTNNNKTKQKNGSQQETDKRNEKYGLYMKDFVCGVVRA